MKGRKMKRRRGKQDCKVNREKSGGEEGRPEIS